MAEIETYAKPTWLFRYRSLGLGAGGGINLPKTTNCVRKSTPSDKDTFTARHTKL
jgi:hypothetical protein